MTMTTPTTAAANGPAAAAAVQNERGDATIDENGDMRDDDDDDDDDMDHLPQAPKKMPGQNRIYTAGEKEYYAWLERKDKGVPFNNELLEEFRGLCINYHLEEYLPHFTS
jgi:LDH2 family malate/lactate/ureidoglycolate dehydrogenase